MTRAGRITLAATAAAAVTGIVIQLLVTAAARGGHFHPAAARVANVFAFFTIDSNVIVAVTCLLLAVRPGPAGRVLRSARLTGLVAIAITGIVYHVALRGLLDLDTWGLAADVLLHTVVSVLAVAGWVITGPRGLTSRAVAFGALVFPLAWLVFTLSRGAAIGWYPYPFLDVTRIGYLKAVINCCWVAVLFGGLAATATALDRRLPGAPAPQRAPE
jgi:hypothetical protein